MNKIFVKEKVFNIKDSKGKPKETFFVEDRKKKGNKVFKQKRKKANVLIKNIKEKD